MDKEKRGKIQQDYRRRNREILRKKAKQFRESKEGREKRKKYQQKYRKKNREKMKEYERRRYMKKKDGRKIEEERLMNVDQNLVEETVTRILPNEIEPPQNLRQVENMYERREMLSEESKRLFDEIEKLYNLI
ncbi:uncharacterized protein [Pocillopora verrucosa]|uniref:uncharacterized protein n=1 Tax=Pocillopora verrucosa TaxID=203993 RepID=UPI00333E6242